MDSRPFNPLLPLILTSLLHFWQCARGQSSYIIDSVDLTIRPNGTVQSGTSVTLFCHVVVSHDNSLHLTNTFKFTRDDILIHSETTKEDTVQYDLKPARAADSGHYECQVTVKDKRKSSISQLTVTGLQTPTLLLSKKILYESEDFIATCSAPEEKGDLVFRFYQQFRTGEVQQLKQTVPAQKSSETKLALKQVGDSHLFCDYEIILVSGSRRSESSNKIRVIVKVLHISPIMNVLPATTVYEGDIIEVVCKVVNPPSNLDVFLTKDRRILKKASVSLNHRFTALEDHSGELVCKAEWGNMQKETHLNITVKELFSKPRLTVEPLDIFEGDKFKLSCSVSVYVPEKINNQTTISIYKDNVTLSSGYTYLAVAQPDKNGNYRCITQATSATHSFIKESPTVVVKAKVPVSEPKLSVVGGVLVLGKPFQLLCHSDSGTLPISYTLHGPNRMPSVKVVSKPGEQAIFNTSAIYKSSDIDNFLCHAKNNQNKPPVAGSGQQLLRSTKIIEPVSKPLLTTQPDIGYISEGQEVTLFCSVKRGTPPLNFTWFHNESKNALHSQTSKNLRGTYSIKHVKGEHKGIYYCVSTNEANEPQRSPAVVIGVKLAGWKIGLIVVFCILLILAFILVIIFKTRLRQFKRKRTGKLSVKSASTKTERLSLTQAEVNEAANVTPGMIGKSVWSEHASGSESDDQNSVTSPGNPEPEYTEVQTRQADPNKAPVNKGTDTVYSEVRNSKQGAPEEAVCQGLVEYAQLNRDTDHHIDHGEHGNRGNHSVQDDHIDETDNTAVTDTANHEE